VFVDHKLVDLDRRLLSVVQLGGVDSVTEPRQLILTFAVRLQAVLKHLLTDRHEVLLVRIGGNVKK